MRSVEAIADDIIAREGGFRERSRRPGRGDETRCHHPHDAPSGARFSTATGQ